jgi:poly-gamma-glutamate synthesis protein (capsule biosynthesis protein)
VSDRNRRAILRAVGDVALIAGAAQALIERRSVAWRETASILSAADVTFANFEMALPLGESERVAPDVSPDLIGVSAALDPFLEAGVDVVALATNHIMDWGVEGLADTLAQFRERGVETVGAGMSLDEAVRAVVIERAGLKIGFAAFTPEQRWTAGPDRPGAAPLRFELVRKALEGMGDADVRIISLHWGLEMSSYPTPEDRELARRIAGAGADLILGHHPHVIQGVEQLDGTHVVYSMGNFIFDINAGRVEHGFDPEDLRSAYMIEVELDASGVARLRTVPIWLDDDGIGGVAAGDRGERIAERVESCSEQIEEGAVGVWEHAGGTLVRHKLKCMRVSLRDGGIRFVFSELKRVRMRHFKLLWGYIVGRLRRDGGGAR